jgi:hypothetical protein
MLALHADDNWKFEGVTNHNCPHRTINIYSRTVEGTIEIQPHPAINPMIVAKQLKLIQ